MKLTVADSRRPYTGSYLGFSIIYLVRLALMKALF
jgi:hypothetical protein